MHLKTGALIDIAEGTQPEASAPHLAACEPCRAQLNELRAMMSAARDVDVPEPSPLFWDHLSARVSDAVATEAVDARLKPSRSVLGATVGAFAALFGSRAFRLRSLEPDARFGETRRSAIGAKAVQASAVVAASLIVVVALSSRLTAPHQLASADARSAPPPPPALIVDTNASTEVLGDVASDDASWMLVASLASTLDLDAASDAGLAPRGSAEHAVTHMSESELRELGRLLKEELDHS